MLISVLQVHVDRWAQQIALSTVFLLAQEYDW